MVTVGSYRYVRDVYDIRLGDFIGSTLSMAFVSHSIRQATRFRILPIPLPFSNPLNFWLCLILFKFSGSFLFRLCSRLVLLLSSVYVKLDYITCTYLPCSFSVW